MPKVVPTLLVEQQWWAGGQFLVAGMDEVGRGALAGPVTVGVVVLDPTCTEVPDGLADSKVLSAKKRSALVPVVHRWAVDCNLGEASAQEIDEYGIVEALRFAGQRALAGLTVFPDVVLLDGEDDYLSDPNEEVLWNPDRTVPAVATHPKGDANIAAISAASIIAKVYRDAMMADQADVHPGYGWERNAGYGSQAHQQAIRTLGPSPLHRMTWLKKTLKGHQEPPACAPAVSSTATPGGEASGAFPANFSIEDLDL